MKTFPAGSIIFSRPTAQEGKREVTGPTKWATHVYFDPPVNPEPTTTRLPEPEQLQHLNKTGSPSDTSLLIIQGRIGELPTQFLIDSGASRNFVSPNLKLPTLTISPVRVKLADGDIMVTNKAVRVTYTLEPHNGLFEDEFLQVPLGSGGAILGQSWLKKYNPTINWQKQTVMLQDKVLLRTEGFQQTTLQVLTAKKFFKLLRAEKDPAIFCAIVTAAAGEAEETEGEDSAFDKLIKAIRSKRIRRLVAEHPEAFQVPNQLPPRRTQYHAIELSPNSSIPPQKVYKMSPAELKEVRKQLANYTEKGWIRPSNSPFGSCLCARRTANSECA